MSGKKKGKGKRHDRFVLDSFSLLAYLEGDGGADDVEEILSAGKKKQADIWMSVVNLGEVLYITEREQTLEAAQAALAAVDQLPIVVLDADSSFTLGAAHVKAHHSISYADAFAVSLAMNQDAEIVTGDPDFEKVKSLVHICWISQAKSASDASAVPR